MTELNLTFVIDRPGLNVTTVKILFDHLPRVNDTWLLVRPSNQEIRAVIQAVTVWPDSRSALINCQAVADPARQPRPADPTAELWLTESTGGHDE